MSLIALLTMLQTASNTYVVSSTDLKRKYQEVRMLLKGNHIVIVTNRNADDEVDGVLMPYSEALIEHLDDLLEDLEMEQNRETLEDEFEESLKSAKGKRIPLDNVSA